MKINYHQLPYFLLGCFILMPVSFMVAGTQIFYVQTSLIIFMLIAMVFNSRGIGIKKNQTLDVIFYSYLVWTLISFLLNFAFSFDDFEIQGRRFFSIGMAFLLFSGFFIGKTLLNVENSTDSLVKGIFFTYLLVILSICFIFLIQPSLDLYIVRRIIGQRLPFAIAFVSSLAAAYFILAKESKMYFFLIAISGVLIVIFSLTRAAYIQIFISFVILFIKEIRKYFFKGLLLATFLLIIGYILLKSYSDVSVVKQITSRIELLFDYEAQSKEDISGTFRLEMWRFISNKLLNDPVRLVIGYGQLGPSHISRDFILSDGTSGTSSAHNQYLDIVVREGLIGLLLFLWLCYKSVTIGLSFSNVLTSKGVFIFANSIGLVGIMFYSFFHETFRYPLFGFYFWLYLGILSKISHNK